MHRRVFSRGLVLVINIDGGKTPFFCSIYWWKVRVNSYFVIQVRYTYRTYLLTFGTDR